MGKNNKPQAEQPRQDYSAALAQANAPSPVQSKLQTMAMGDLDWLEKGDYRDPKGHIFMNFADPAMRKRQRELSYNQKGQGIFGLAGRSANPTALGLAKQNLSAHDAEDDARQYEQNIREGSQRAFATAGDLASMEQARRLGVLGITAGPYQTQLGKPKEPSWFDRLLQGASSAAAGAAAAGSDIRLKDNIQPMVERIKQLNGVTFNWGVLADNLGYPVGSPEGGVLAQEVEKVFPELVTTGDDGFKRVNYMTLTGLLVETVKALA